MAAPPSRTERLVKLLGENNLPPKLPQADTPKEVSANDAKAGQASTNPFDELQSVDSFLQEEKSDNWWDATPQLSDLGTEVNGTTIATNNSHHTTLESDPRRGESAPLGLSFSPFLAVTKFPYKFVHPRFSQPVASAFFDANKIYNRDWDVYYIWSDYYDTDKPVTFIPEHQVLALIDEINEAFPEAKVSLSEELRESGLVINFDNLRDCPDLRPRWLGHSTSRDQYESWRDSIAMPKLPVGTVSPTDRSLQAFKEKMELATEIAKNKSKATKAKKQGQNVANRQTMMKAFQRAQRYLGLLDLNDTTIDLSTLNILPVDHDAPVASPFEQDVIFIAFDVEAWERAPRMVTEIGVATLDTRELGDQAPGEVAKKWQQFIRARHFRIAEYKDYRNSEFVQGCPDHFEFGTSEFIGNDSIGRELAKCFKPPYSASITTPANIDEKRNIVLVGHDVSQDINYLQKVGFNVLNSGSLIDRIDTAELFRVYTKDPNPRSLGSILYEFDLAGWHLHNAGNDAVYTLWALLAICTKDACERGSEEKGKKDGESKEKRTQAAVEQAKDRVKDELEGWEDSGSGEDGGVEVSEIEAAEKENLKRDEGSEKDRGLYTAGGAILDV